MGVVYPVKPIKDPRGAYHTWFINSMNYIEDIVKITDGMSYHIFAKKTFELYEREFSVKLHYDTYVDAIEFMSQEDATMFIMKWSE